MANVDILNDPLRIPGDPVIRIGASKNRWRKIGSGLTNNGALTAPATGPLVAANTERTGVWSTDNCPCARLFFAGAGADNATVTTLKVVLWYPLALQPGADALAYTFLIVANADATLSALTYAVNDIGTTTYRWVDYINETMHRPSVYVVSPADDSCPGYIELDVRGAAGIEVFSRRNSATAVDVWLQLGEFISPFVHSGLGEFYTESSITMAAGTTGAVVAHNALVVTGLVRYEIVTEVVATLTDAAGLGRIIVGTADDTDSIHGQGTTIITDSCLTNTLLPVDGADLTLYASYIDSPGDVDCVARGTSNGRNVIYTISGEALTGGTLKFHCRWWPREPGANVAPGVGD